MTLNPQLNIRTLCRASVINRNFCVLCFYTLLIALFPTYGFGDFLLIDDFDSGPGSVQLGPEQSGSVSLDISGIDSARTFGGERHIFADGQATEIDSLLVVDLHAPTGGGPFFNEFFAFNSSGVIGYRWGQNTNLNLAIDQIDLGLANATAVDDGCDFEVTVSMN